MKRFVTTIVLTVFMGVVAAGCGNIASNPFVGNWVNSERAAETLEVTRNGDSFTVTQSTPTMVAKIINNNEKLSQVAVTGNYRLDQPLDIIRSLASITSSRVSEFPALVILN